jgi:hypothetical protein
MYEFGETDYVRSVPLGLRRAARIDSKDAEEREEATPGPRFKNRTLIG